MEINYMIKSEILDSLKVNIEKAITLIKEHIKSKNPILIRHHNDADGYCGAIAIENAISPLIYDAHTKERDTWYAYARKPSLSPYYSYEDANKDLAFLFTTKTYTTKEPLVIVIDNGSSIQDRMALEKLKIYGVKIIVIDHHPADKIIDEIVDVHINPNLVGSTYDFSAGMVCAEIANILRKDDKTNTMIASVSGFADKVKSNALKQYSQLADKHEYDNNFIVNLAEVIDYEAQSLGFMEARTLVSDMFGSDIEKQKKLISLVSKDIAMKKAIAFNSAMHYTHISRLKDKNIALLPISAVTFRGEYPSNGKIVGMIHDHVSKEEGKPTITAGYSESMITLRGTTDSGLDVNVLIKELSKKFPYAQIDGGGHAKAGSIRFVPAAFEQVKSYLLELIRNG